MVHVILLFLRGFQTVIGSVSETHEIYLINKCGDVRLEDLVRVSDVTCEKSHAKNRLSLGNSEFK